MTQSAHLTPVITDRGFAHLPEIVSDYGGSVRVYESSAAEHPAIWLTVEGKPGLVPSAETVSVPMHLSVEAATQLAEQIQHLVSHHYQGASE